MLRELPRGKDIFYLWRKNLGEQKLKYKNISNETNVYYFTPDGLPYITVPVKPSKLIELEMYGGNNMDRDLFAKIANHYASGGHMRQHAAFKGRQLHF